MMRILITGSRDWDDGMFVYRVLTELCETHNLNHEPDKYGNTIPDPRKITVVHGACPTGADFFADQWSVGNFLEPECYPALWRIYGKRAGFIRNEEMVESGADICLAFIKNNSRGASMTVDLARKAGIETVVYER